MACWSPFYISLCIEVKDGNMVLGHFKDGQLYIVDVGQKFNRCYVLSLGDLDRSIAEDMLGEDEYLIYGGNPASDLVFFLIDIRKKWQVVDSYFVS